jgi:hypothetical protein
MRAPQRPEYQEHNSSNDGEGIPFHGIGRGNFKEVLESQKVWEGDERLAGLHFLPLRV